MKKILLLFAALTFSVSLWAQTTPAAPSKGTGTKTDPYQITSYAELKWFSAQVNQGGDNVFLCAKLMNDIEGTIISGGQLAYADYLTPIGRSEAGFEFRGEFDGNGHIIRDMQVGWRLPTSFDSQVGLIGKMISGAHVHHVGLVDCIFYGAAWVGAICGDFANGEIDHCFVQDCSVNYSSNAAGGLVGSCYTNAKLHDCYCSCRVIFFGSSGTTTIDIGALCGALYGTMTNCYGEVKENMPSAAIGKKYDTPTTKNVEMKQHAAFASGEVCYLLNNGITDGSQAWYQTLGTDIYPTWDKNHGTVYATKGASGMVYTNTKPQTTTTYHPQSEPTCEQRGYAQDCWEDEATGKLYADALCTRELNPAVVIRYAKFATSPISTLNSYAGKEDAAYNGVPFHWAAVKEFGPTPVTVEEYSMDFIVRDDNPTYARIKWYKKYIERFDERYPEYFDFEVKVNQMLVTYTQISDGDEHLFYLPLDGLKKGDIVTVYVRRGGYSMICHSAVAAALEYCSPHCGAISDITITPTAPSWRKAQGTADPEFSYKVDGNIFPSIPLQGITVTRETGEDPGTYTVTASCPEGANPNYNIHFNTATFTIANTTYHEASPAPDCQTLGWTKNCWEADNKYYTDAFLTKEISRDDAIQYRQLTTPGWVSLTNLWDNPWAILTELNLKNYNTQKGYFIVYGRNVVKARLKILIMLTNYSDDMVGEVIKYSYHGQSYEISYKLTNTKTIYAPLENLKYGDEIQIEVPLSEYLRTVGTSKEAKIYIKIDLEYLSDNCGDAGSLVPLTITGTPTVSGKEWDGTTEVEQSAINLTSCQLVGIDAADEGKVQLTATATYDNAEVGNNHTVTLTYGILVTDEALVGKYQLYETVELVTVTNVPITYPQTVANTKDAAKQALTDKAGEQPSTEVQAIVTEYNGKIDNVALTGSVKAVIDTIEMIKTEGLSMINSQQSIEQYLRDLATEKTAAKQALKEKIGDISNKEFDALVAEYSNQIDMQTTIKDVQDVRDEGLRAIENALKFYNASKDDLPTDAQNASGHTVTITKGGKKLKLVNPEKVIFGKQE